MAYLFLGLTVLLASAAQLLLKQATNSQLGSFPGLTISGIRYLFDALFNVYVIGSFILGFLGSLTWIAAVSRMDLGYAYPFTSLGFVVVVIASAWLFREPLPWIRLFGIFVICLGVFLVSRS